MADLLSGGRRRGWDQRGNPLTVTSKTITAIIPLYNGREFIQGALESVLAQTVAPNEIIVVDDGSTDDGPEIVRRIARSHPLILLQKANGGQSSARNTGIAHARGDLIALLDQDDIWYPNHLEELVKPFLQPRPVELGWVYSNLDEMDRAGNMIGHAVLDKCTTPHPKDNLFTCLREDVYVLPTASVISRAALNALGGFDESLSGYEDDDLFLRMFRAGYDHVYVSQALARWRIYPTSASHSSRMTSSRMAFARKLLRGFPDDASTNRNLSRDLIVPRFLPHAISEARKALRSGDKVMIDTCIADVAFLRGHVPKGHAGSAECRDFLISVVIPLYNGGEFIQEALESVLTQTTMPDEIIVVDDGSTDNGPEIVRRVARSHPITLLRKENGGQSSARNFGIARAHGDLIALLDQDDIWYPHHLATLVEPFREVRPSDLGWTYSNLDRIDLDGSMLIRSFLSWLPTAHPKQSLVQCLGQDMFVLPSAALISRKAFQEVGGFDETLSGYEDDDLFLRMFRAGYDNHFIDAPLSRWRIYSTSTSYSSRMARSRRIYAEKLLRSYPDEPREVKYYTTRVIAPRFFRQMLAEYRKAIKYGTRREAGQAFDDLCFIVPRLHWKWRYIAMALLPLLWFRPLARLLLAVAGLLRGLRSTASRRTWGMIE